MESGNGEKKRQKRQQQSSIKTFKRTKFKQQKFLINNLICHFDETNLLRSCCACCGTVLGCGTSTANPTCHDDFRACAPGLLAE